MWGRCIASTLMASALLTAEARADGSQTWTFDVTTTGNDVTWNAPSAVNASASIYNAAYAISLVEVDVLWNGIPFNNLDVTDQVPPEQLANSGSGPGPAPVNVINSSFVYPLPPEVPAIAADLTAGLDAGGFGFATAANVTLGSLDIDLGIFGVQTVTLTSLRVVGDLTIHPTWFDLGNGLAGASGVPQLTGDGTWIAGDPITLSVSNAAASAPAALFVGFATLNAPFKGGILVPTVNLLRLGFGTNPSGALVLSAPYPGGVPTCTSLYFQFWIADAGGPAGFAATNAIEGVTP